MGADLRSDTARFGAGDSIDNNGEPLDSAEESDQLLELGDKITTLAAHIHAATHRLLVMLAEFDERGGWKPGGHRSCADWLAFQTGFDPGACRERVRAARALVGLPEMNASMARGELSFAKVRALTRVATADNESALLDFARNATAAQTERLVRSWKDLSRFDEAERERLRHQSRTLWVAPDNEGMYVIRGRLDAEVGALLMRAIEAASDALYVEEGQLNGDDLTSERRRADAVGLLAERALAAGMTASDTPLTSGSRAERYQVMLHVEAATLDAETEPGISELSDGTRVSAETSRRIACDCGVVHVTKDSRGEVLDVGRRTRTIPGAIRRALDVRDGGCRFPGCGLRFTDAHHIIHWADGGETKLDNLVLLCRHHHRLVHEEGWRVAMRAGEPIEFSNPDGGCVVRRSPAWRDEPLRSEFTLVSDLIPAEMLVAANALHGANPDWRTPTARWKRDADIEESFRVAAWEALDR